MAAGPSDAGARALEAAVAAMESGMANCETAEQGKMALRAWRGELEDNEDSWAYLAYCAKHPEMVLDEPEDPSAAARVAEWQYTGPWVKPWNEALRKRVFAHYDDGTTLVPVRAVQRGWFGMLWCREWQQDRRVTAGTGEEEDVDPLQCLGPKDEVKVDEASPPAGCSWGELAEMQRVERREWERSRRGEWEFVRALRAMFRRLRSRVKGSRGKEEDREDGDEQVVPKRAGWRLSGSKRSSKVKSRQAS